MTGRNCERDYAMVLVGYRHAMRVNELVALEWSQFDEANGILHVSRSKGSRDGQHYMEADTIKALKALPKRGRFIFQSERGNGHITESGAYKVIKRLGDVAGVQFPIHPHMLRHTKATSLIDRGVNAFDVQNFLGHRSIKSTMEYVHGRAEASRGLSGD